MPFMVTVGAAAAAGATTGVAAISTCMCISVGYFIGRLVRVRRGTAVAVACLGVGELRGASLALLAVCPQVTRASKTVDIEVSGAAATAA